MSRLYQGDAGLGTEKATGFQFCEITMFNYCLCIQGSNLELMFL